MIKLTEDVYRKLIQEDLEWLEKMPDSLEKDHIEDILKSSVSMFYSEPKDDNAFKAVQYNSTWYWGKSVMIVKDDGMAMISVKFDEKTFPNTGYICSLLVHESHQKKGFGYRMMKLAIDSCREQGVGFVRLHVNKNQEWLVDWYKRLGFKELSRDDYELELIKEL